MAEFGSPSIWVTAYIEASDRVWAVSENPMPLPGAVPYVLQMAGMAQRPRRERWRIALRALAPGGWAGCARK